MSGITTVVVLDTETTGTDAAVDSLLEVAWVPVTWGEALGWELAGAGAPGDAFVEYEGVIPPEARAVHHIHPLQVAPGAPNCFPRDVVEGQLQQAEVPGEMMYAAHNAAFDKGFLPGLTLPWICTYRCAMHIYPDAPSHKNQVLRYYLDLQPNEELMSGLAPHRALYDTAVTAELLRVMLQDNTPERLLELTNTPILLDTVRFGKHRGEKWADLPADYLRWMIRSGNWANDVDVTHTIGHYLYGPSLV